MTFAEAVLAALRGFAAEVATWTNQGSLVSIAGHIAQVESALAQDVHAGEIAAKAVLRDLYGAFHGAPAVPVLSATSPLATAGSGAVTPPVFPVTVQTPVTPSAPAAPTV
jgi:hypothetical protein